MAKLNIFQQLTHKLAILLLIAFISIPRTSHAQQNDAQQCNMEILSPKAGDHIAESAIVKGTARTPAGKDVWVFVHVKGLALWWPQGAGPAQVENGKWEVLAYFGGPQDIGRDFEIAVAVLEPNETKELQEWFKKGDETGRYPGMRFPPVVHGCPVPHITVNKTR